jgi:hypothetical protein
MSLPDPPLEDRLRTALRAEAAAVTGADGVDPAGDSLGTIRGRAQRVRRRRVAAVAGVAAVVVVAGALVGPRLGRDRERLVTGHDGPAPSTPTSPPVEPGGPLWPGPGGPTFSEPAAAAQAFVAAVVGVDDAPLSDVRPDGDRAAAVDVLGRAEDGRPLDRVVSTIGLRRDGGGWFVTGATSPDVVIDSPAPAATVESPVRVTGQGRGFEGTIGVSLRRRSSPEAELASVAVIAGSGAELAPFTADLDLASTPAGAAILVASTDAGATGAVPAFAAQGAVLPRTPFTFRNQPLYPFADRAEVDAWVSTPADQRRPAAAADPESVALAFAHDYLGFTEIDTVTSRELQGDEAWIGVGSRPEGTELTAAVVHVVRWGTASDAPWEVVGTRDNDLTLETPAYASEVSSPVDVGGRITGVDESLRVRVHQLGSDGPIGEACCLAAGGTASPWSTTVSYQDPTRETLTIVVSTGGHVQDVERFAVTGVRPG